VLFEEKLTAWYILAGGTRDFQLAVPAERCAAVRSFSAEVRVSGSSLKETLQAPAGACNR